MSTAYQKTAGSANAEVIVPAEANRDLGEVVESAKEGLLALAVGTGPKVLLGPDCLENATCYACTRSGLVLLGRSLARELGIHTSLVAPGVIDTPQLEVDAKDAGPPLKEIHKIYVKGIPTGLIGTLGEVAPAYVGRVLHPNGGEIRCSM